MKPYHYGIVFLASVLLASITFISPWAEAVFQIGKFASTLENQVEATGEQLTLPVFFWDKSLRVNGCPRGQVGGLDNRLDLWIGIGKITFVGQVCLWFTFIVGAAFRARFRMVAVSSASLVLLFLFFLLMVSGPIIECIYVQFPPPLLFANQWNVSIVNLLLSLANLFCGIWINGSIFKVPFKEKAN